MGGYARLSIKGRMHHARTKISINNICDPIALTYPLWPICIKGVATGAWQRKLLLCF